MEIDKPIPKFSIGDYVYIRPDAKSIPELTLENNMLKYLGTTQQICWIWYIYSPHPLRNIFVYYLTDIKKPNAGFWCWAEEWLEPVNEDEIEIDEESIISMLVFKDD